MKKETLINKNNLLEREYVPSDLISTDNNENNFHKYKDATQKPTISASILPHFLLMKEAAKQAGIEFIIDSGYRSYDYQQVIWESSVLENGLEETRTLVALPGSSEHQTGLAFDIAYIKNGVYTDDVKESDKEVAWLMENASRYGFIMRYPKGKEDITKYQFEPWHYRFVGVPMATICSVYNITLEEYYLDKEKYDSIAQVIKDPLFITKLQFIAALLVIKQNTSTAEINSLLWEFKSTYPDYDVYYTSLEFMQDLYFMKNDIYSIKKDINSEELFRLRLIAGEETIKLIEDMLNKKEDLYR